MCITVRASTRHGHAYGTVCSGYGRAAGPRTVRLVRGMVQSGAMHTGSEERELGQLAVSRGARPCIPQRISSSARNDARLLGGTAIV